MTNLFERIRNMSQQGSARLREVNHNLQLQGGQLSTGGTDLQVQEGKLPVLDGKLLSPEINLFPAIKPLPTTYYDFASGRTIVRERDPYHHHLIPSQEEYEAILREQADAIQNLQGISEIFSDALVYPFELELVRHEVPKQGQAYIETGFDEITYVIHPPQHLSVGIRGEEWSTLFVAEAPDTKSPEDVASFIRSGIPRKVARLGVSEFQNNSYIVVGVAKDRAFPKPLEYYPARVVLVMGKITEDGLDPQSRLILDLRPVKGK